MEQTPFIGTPAEHAAWCERLGVEPTAHPDSTLPYRYAEGARVETVHAPLALVLALVLAATVLVVVVALVLGGAS